MLLATTSAGLIFTVVVLAIFIVPIVIAWMLGGRAGRAMNDLHEIRKQGETKDP